MSDRTISTLSPRTSRSSQPAGFRLSAFQRRMLEGRAAALEGTAARLRFYGQRTYMEIVNLYFALHKIPLLSGEIVRIDFLCIAAHLWTIWQSVYEACLADERIKARVILLDRAGPLLKDASYMDAEVFLERRGIPFIPYEDYAPDEYRPHIVMYQFPHNPVYEGFRKVSPDLVKLRGSRPVYIPYCIEYDEAYRKDVTDGLHYHNYAQSLAWRAYVMHEDIREGYFRACRTGGAHVHALGHPRFDIYARKTPPLPEHIAAIGRGRTMLLYNVHFPCDHDYRRAGRRHSLPVEESIAILLWLAEQDDICTVIPLRALIESGEVKKHRATAQSLERMERTVRQNPNIALHPGEYQTLLPHMDALISDPSSLLLEMACRNKPTLYLFDEPLARKPFAEEIFASFYHGGGSGQGLADVQAFVARLRNGEDPLAEERQHVWDKYFSTCDGRIGQRITDHMLTALHAEGSGSA